MVLGLVGGAFASLAVASIAIANLGGLPWRQAPEAVRMAQTVDYDPAFAFRTGTCFLDLEQGLESFDRESCLKAAPGLKTYLLLGDSHAAHHYDGLKHIVPGENLMQATASGCEPQYGRYSSQRWCGPLMRYMFEEYLPSNPPDVLILAADWNTASAGPLAETLAWAKSRGIETAVIGPTLEYSAPLPVLLAEEVRRSDPALAARHVQPGTRRLDRALKQMVEDLGVRYVSIIDAFCTRGVCPELTPKGEPIYFDEDHFTHDGAHFVAASLDRVGAFE